MNKSRSLLTALLIASAAIASSWFLLGSEDQASAATPEKESPNQIDIVSPATLAQARPVNGVQLEENLPAPSAARVDQDSARQRTSAHSRFSVRGQVIDDRGKPIQADFVVFYATSTPPAISQSATFEAAEGSFELELPRAGEWSFRATAQGHHDSVDALIVEIPQAADSMIELQLVRHSLVEGQVLDPAGLPVADAEVECRPSSRVQQESARSDEQGYFVLRGLSAGVIELQATHAAWSASLNTEIDLALDEIVSDVVLVLRTGGTITGEAFERDGSPAAHHRVQLEPLAEDAAARTLATDDAGRFEFLHTTPGLYGIAMEYDEETESGLDERDALAWFSETARITVEVRHGETSSVVLGKPMDTAVVVHGLVTRAGKPVRDMTLIVARGTVSRYSMRAVSVGQDGTYKVTLERAGEHQFLFLGDKDKTAGEFARNIPQAKLVELNFALPSGAIQGRVLDPLGKPAEDMTVVLAREDGFFSLETLATGVSTSTDKQGRFEFQNLRAGEYAVRTSGDFGPNSDKVAATALHTGLVLKGNEVLSGIEIRMGAACELTGKVTDSAGKGLRVVSIFVRDDQGRLLSNRPLATSDSSGLFTLFQLPRGELQITAHTKRLVSRAPLRVQAGAPNHELVSLVLEPGTLLRIAAEGVQNFRLSVRSSDGIEYANMIDDNSWQELGTGGFSSARRNIGPLPPGRYTVIATTNDGREVKRTVQLTGEPSFELELRFE